jgi:hypothetical protein
MSCSPVSERDRGQAVNGLRASGLFDSDALYIAIDRQRRQRRISFRQIAREAGLQPNTTTRLGQGRAISADVLIRLLIWLGETDLKPYIKEVAW